MTRTKTSEHPELPKSDPATHYVDNKLFYQACVEHKQKSIDAEIAGLGKPRLSDYIGSCLVKICTRFSYSKKYCNYPFRQEMVGDAIENCIQYFHNFNSDKYNNPYGYFTKVAYYAFLRRIHEEKTELYTKFKAMLNKSDDSLFSHQDVDAEAMFDGVNVDDAIRDNDYMKDFVNKFEAKLRENEQKSRDKRAAKKAEAAALAGKNEDNLSLEDFVDDFPELDIE